VEVDAINTPPATKPAAQGVRRASVDLLGAHVTQAIPVCAFDDLGVKDF
jgi:hypothetical protein